MNADIVTYRKSIINRSFWMAAGLAIILTLIGHKPFALGIIIGIFIGAVNFHLLSKQVSQIGLAHKKGKIVGSFLFRYALLGICIYFVVQAEAINIFGFLVGFLLLQANIFISSFIGRKKTTDDPDAISFPKEATSTPKR
jgi:hypothetical protein